MPAAKWKIVADTYETSVRGYPVVSHTFNGVTKAEALGYFKAHKKTDSFFAGCLKGHFGIIACMTKVEMFHRPKLGSQWLKVAGVKR